MNTSTLVTFLAVGTTEISSIVSTYTVNGQTIPAVFEQTLPRGYKLPAVVVHRYNGARDQSMLGPVNAREDNFQLDIYGDTQADCDAVANACRALLVGYVGTMPDGTVVMGAYLEQDRDMPFLANADTKSLAFRALLGLRFVSQV